MYLLILDELAQSAAPRFDVGGDAIKLFGCRVELGEQIIGLTIELLVGHELAQRSLPCSQVRDYAFKIVGHAAKIIIELRVVEQLRNRASAFSHATGDVLKFHDRAVEVHI